jgi:hypothetical protein
MSSLVLNGDTSGSVTVTVPAVAGTNSVTLPAAAGTVMVSGNMPAFSAYLTAAQGFSNSTFSQMVGWTKNFDTATAFNAGSNGRFIPQVAGYYQINGQVAFGSASTGFAQIAIYKNGGQFSTGSTMSNNTAVGAMCMVSDVIYLNGSTDYVELWVWQNSGGSISTQSGSFINKFSGAMVRSA